MQATKLTVLPLPTTVNVITHSVVKFRTHRPSAIAAILRVGGFKFVSQVQDLMFRVLLTVPHITLHNKSHGKM